MVQRKHNSKSFLREGDAMATTIKDVAKYAKLSKTTVSKYINGGNLEPENRIAIMNAIEALDYSPNHIARGFRNSKTFTVGVLIPTLNSMYTTTIITTVESILEKKGYGILVCNCNGQRDNELGKIEFLVNKKIDGLIIMPSTLEASDLIKIKKQKIPLVLLDKPIPDYNADVVLINNADAALRATNYLLDNGHEKIAIICGGRGVYTSDERKRGYCQAFKEKGLLPDPAFIKHGDFTLKNAYNTVIELMSQTPRPTAIFTTNYDTSVGAIIALNKLGVKIPDDISFIGFDDIYLSEIIKPSLTMVSQPMEEIGANAAELLLRRMKNDNSDFPHTVCLDSIFEINASVLPI